MIFQNNIHDRGKKYLIRREPWLWLWLLLFSTVIIIILRDHDRTIIPLRVLSRISFCCRKNKKWTDDRHLTSLCLGVAFKYHKLRKFVSKKPFCFRETWNVDIICRQLEKNQFIFHKTWSWPPPLPSSVLKVPEILFFNNQFFSFELLSFYVQSWSP